MSSTTQRLAVLDLGTNTFQLLIAEHFDKLSASSGERISFIFRDEQWAYLAEEGIEKIGERALQRMETILADYKKIIDGYQVDFIKATGTAAFRKASNSDEARILVRKIIGISPEIISGDEEAILIYQGVHMAAKEIDKTVLVMDIGGGSTEFIIGKAADILWKKSYPLGATLLRQKFHHNEPITADERQTIHDYVLQLTEDLREAVLVYQPVSFIGASGSFDSFASMLLFPTVSESALVELDKNDLVELFERLFTLDEVQRKNIPGLVWFRVGPIVAAAALTQTILRQFSFRHIYKSAYALKEGIVKNVVAMS
jgi:exopolyphosphatase / guanosine-5'-triphosphate,3'-diphosphate pyrophosphatase